MLGVMLTAEHNLWFYQALMAAMREAIGEGAVRAGRRSLGGGMRAECRMLRHRCG